jgi:hypothetical protein
MTSAPGQGRCYGLARALPLCSSARWKGAGVQRSSAHVKIASGDALFIRSGRWARRAKVGPWNAAREAAGLHTSATPWIRQHDISLPGSDGVNDVQPSGIVGAGEAANRPVRTLIIAVMGVPLVDNAYGGRRQRSRRPQALGVLNNCAIHPRSRRNRNLVQRARNILSGAGPCPAPTTSRAPRIPPPASQSYISS